MSQIESNDTKKTAEKQKLPVAQTFSEYFQIVFEPNLKRISEQKEKETTKSADDQS